MRCSTLTPKARCTATSSRRICCLTRRASSVWPISVSPTVEEESLSQTGDVVGTLRYMAPEQFSGHADARSDVYSLGLTLYELLALKPAFEDSDRSSLIRKITQDEVVPLRTVNPNIPRDLETIVAKATAREPSQRTHPPRNWPKICGAFRRIGRSTRDALLRWNCSGGGVGETGRSPAWRLRR